MRAIYWLTASSLSLLLHAILAFGFMSFKPETEYGATGAGEIGVSVGLGMLGSGPETMVAENLAVAEQTPEPEENKDEPAASMPVEPEPAPAPEPEPEPEPEPAPAPEAVKQKVSKTDEPGEARKSQSASVASTGSASDTAAEGTTGDPQVYLGQINAWLKQFHRYPLQSKRRKEEGVVQLSFRIDRNGEVTEATVRQGSGHERLDKAALELIAEASPVPRIPDFMDRETLKLVIPIEYSLITNSN